MKNNSSDDEKHPNYGQGVVEPYTGDDSSEEHEVFKKTNEGVDFRTVGWPRASIIFLKSQSHHDSILQYANDEQ